NVYGSSYTHDDEIVKPGYHKVVLKDYGIKAELSTTTRVGFHRYTFPASQNSHILFDFTTVLGSSKPIHALVSKKGSQCLEGYVTMGASVRRPKPITVFFTVLFDKEFEIFGGWKNGAVIRNAEMIEGPQTGVFVQFKTGADETRKMKVAISYVSVEEARKNLQAELSHWDFDRVVKESQDEWNSWLGRIEVEGGSLTDQRRFYTDLWHALQGRRIVSDVSGSYIDNMGANPVRRQMPLDEHKKPRFHQ